MVHQLSRKSFEGGIVGRAARRPAPMALSRGQSVSTFLEGTQFKILSAKGLFFAMASSFYSAPTEPET
jgi:hypothetical protein